MSEPCNHRANPRGEPSLSFLDDDITLRCYGCGREWTDGSASAGADPDMTAREAAEYGNLLWDDAEADPTVPELNAEVRRAIEAANYGMGLNIPTDDVAVNTLRASLHSGDFALVRRAGADPEPKRIIDMSDERWADYMTGFRDGYDVGERRAQGGPPLDAPETWTVLYDDYEKGTAFLTADPAGSQEAIAEGLPYEVAEDIAVAHNAAAARLGASEGERET